MSMDLVFVVKWVKSVIRCALYIFHLSGLQCTLILPPTASVLCSGALLACLFTFKGVSSKNDLINYLLNVHSIYRPLRMVLGSWQDGWSRYLIPSGQEFKSCHDKISC